MIQINKGKEPAAWTAKCATPGFTKYAPIQELRDALIAEQFAICAFCMRRIPTKDQWRTEESLASGAGLDGTERETSKIAHLQSRSRHPELQLKYWNMVAACPGMINGDAHCDKSQESDDVTLPLFKPSLQAAISYRTKDGEIKCAEPQWHQEMTEILKLNNALLKKCRWEVIEGVRRQIEAKKWKTTQLETILKEWENPDKEGKLKPFCGVVVWYLRKKLHQA
ncbi:MAG: hypothetical protein KA239_03470 [Bacteroidia bacterium]|nr:hypothetical protein [Bacteroidia bacterium]